MKIDEKIGIKFLRTDVLRLDGSAAEIDIETRARIIQEIKSRLAQYQLTTGIEEVNIVGVVVYLKGDDSIKSVDCLTNCDKLRRQIGSQKSYHINILL